MSLPRGPWGLSRGSCLGNVGVEKKKAPGDSTGSLEVTEEGG